MSVVSTTSFATQPTQEKTYSKISQDSAVILKKNALFYAYQNHPDQAVNHIIKYISATGDMTIINDHVFDTIKDSAGYINLKNKYQPRVTVLSVIYISVGIVGIFLCALLLFKRRSDKVGSALVALFVLFHSVFILHLSIYIIILYT